MYEILEARELAPSIKFIKLYAPEVATSARAGQFVILRVDEKGERFPLTIYDFDRKEGSISMVFLEVGTSTKKLGALRAGESVRDFLGPLGHPFDVKEYGNVACVGGGVGTPAIYTIAKALKEAGNHVTTIIGARSKDLLILENEMMEVSDEVLVATDDGSKGVKGFVTTVLEKKLSSLDFVVAVGPLPMMKAVADLTRDKVKTIVSLNPIMVDGTGMCGGCRVTVDGKTKFTCVDGPDFDAHMVDFRELMERNRTYVDEEQESHTCRIGLKNA
ncbi:MAG: sulfide/dihydroorotate dehydrogenase-like FAD/NAD-binding protein [Candidatus Altiarchaeota archaeon]